ncbi:transposase [Anabaena sp. FACHB-709]|uniref:Transposase n=2 Tax=Nostocaceae TaxID=1162 RepID=A0A1Z4KFM6_ANAVA|nr:MULTISPECIES: transposase [Nostocaceae]BAY67774.1 transposase [Trichormus variabilis NIES-23]HBW29526.1 IS4/IS5 family transposase [Nostoc sp. UBA8866]MBD2170134.1 transposase [Anabaena cylindrica FACHB-318]MBD2261446.1 transposase [Anabaena sp. FACHB-709]MBD2271030.1 transposase [Nostoc sp. PCC 7120 = FACHB-418]
MTFILNDSDWDKIRLQASNLDWQDSVCSTFEDVAEITKYIDRDFYFSEVELSPGIWLMLTDCTHHHDLIVKTPVHDHTIQISICLSGFIDSEEVHPVLGGTRGYFSGSGISPAYNCKYQGKVRFTCVNGRCCVNRQNGKFYLSPMFSRCLISQPIEQVSGDGGYDTKGCYDTISQRGAKAIIPPLSNAKMQQPHPHSQPHPRDENLRRVNQVGRKQWKQESGYHRRSLSETAIFRLKTINGCKLRRRFFDNQAVELFLQCAALNRMIQLGKPDSYKVEY